MPRPVIDKDVKRLVFTCIPTVPHMEALILLRELPNQMWSADDIAARLYIKAEAAMALLRDLSAAGFLAVAEEDPPLFRYLPISEKHRLAIDRLALVHATDLAGITNLIHDSMRRAVFRIRAAFKN